MNLKLRRSRLDSHVEEYLDELAAGHLSEHTLRSYRGVLQAWLRSGLEPRPWVLELGATPMKPSSVNQRRAVLNAYLNWCIARGYLDANPLTRVRTLRTGRRLNQVLTIEQVARLVENCSNLGKQRVRGEHTEHLGHMPIDAYRTRLAAMVSVQVTAGLRITELCTIRLENIDVERRTVRVIGKGNKEREVRFGRAAKRKLSDWMVWREPLPGPYLFCTQSGHSVTPRVYHKQLGEACWWAGLPAIKPHTLRHTFATHAISSGIPVVDVKDMLGHERLATTMVYVNRRPERGWDRYDSHPLAGEEEVMPDTD